MALTREETDELVQKVISGDPIAFDNYSEQFGAIIHLHTKKFIGAVERNTGGAYDFEDLQQEIWEHIWQKMPTYNSERASMVTWLYLMCPYKPSRIIRYNQSQKRGNGDQLSSLDDAAFGAEDGGNKMSLLDFIVDPHESVDSRAIDQVEMFDSIYALKQFLKTLTETQKIIYLHSIKQVPQAISGGIVGLSQVQVSRIRVSLYSKIASFVDNFPKANKKKSDKFTFAILSNKSDDKLSDELDCDLATIKICREILYEIGVAS